MIRQTVIAMVALLSLIAHAESAVIVKISSGIDVPNLPGFKSYTLTAESTLQDEQIQGVDFAGDGSNDSPNAKGFFGTLNQVGPPIFNTVFQDNNSLIPVLNPGKSAAEDSQFLISTQAANIAVPSGFAEEGPGILQGIWAWTEPQGLSVAFARLVIPVDGFLRFRGSFALSTPRGIVDSPDVIYPIPEPCTAALIAVATAARCGCVRRRRRSLLPALRTVV